MRLFIADGSFSGEKDSVNFKGLVTGNLTMFQLVYGQHELDLVYFSFCFCFFLLLLLGEGKITRVGGWVWEEWETIVIRCII